MFDFDGLILETEEPEFLAWREVWADHGVALELDEWVACIGTVGGFDPVGELERRSTVPVDVDAVQTIRRARSRAMIDALRTLPGVEALLAEAHLAGVRTAIASSSPRSWVASHLERLGLVDRFAHLACVDADHRPKPAPDLYLAACTALGVPPADAVALEDSPNGIIAAKAAGLACIAVPGPLTRALDLSAADAVVTSLDGMTLDRLGRLTGRSPHSTGA
ncbi:MAG TPA: HAD-IA family hydrolase [Acidimicrobiales bacterium]|nr:HAD-IA family hydrolase [Acidimicrobiales bacterium]